MKKGREPSSILSGKGGCKIVTVYKNKSPYLVKYKAVYE